MKQCGQGDRLANMMEQVSRLLANMLDNLAYIYWANGVKYDVRDYHQVILRIISPIELLSS